MSFTCNKATDIVQKIVCPIGLGMFGSSQAEGIDAMAEGFEKDGEQIRILKHNAQLALFFFANGMGEDEPFQDSNENDGCW